MKIRVLFVLLLICQFAWGLDVPKLKGRVNDYTESTLNAQEVKQLEARLKAFEDSTTIQVAVLIMPSLGEEDLKDFSIEVADSWKIGQKGKDNGVIILFFMKEHKSRMEVGYGLEAVIPDAVATWIMDKEVRSFFKVEQYYDGINAAIDKIALCTTGEYQKEIAPAMEQERKTKNAMIGFLVLAVLVGLIGYLHWSISGIGGAIGSPIIWAIIFGPLSLGAAIILIIVGFLGGIIAHGIMSIGLGGGVTGSDFGDGIIFAAVGGGGDGGGGFSGGGGGFGGGGGSGGW